MKIATFKIDVSAETGQRLCGGLLPDATGFRDAQYARGIILDDGSRRVVLCAVDFCEIGGQFYLDWRQIIGRAAGTSSSRVALHTVHQHDAPFLREGMMKVAAKEKLELWCPDWWNRMSSRLEKGIRAATRSFREVSFIGTGQARLTRIASNRRILNRRGKVKATRWSICSPALRRLPVGEIDPWMRSVTFWSKTKTLQASLNYYASHPQCAQGRGLISADAPGEALRLLEAKYPRAMHVYFTGCAGDVTMGKYTTNNLEKNIFQIGRRLLKGMERSIFQSRFALKEANRLSWKSVPLSVSFRVNPISSVKSCLRDPRFPLHERVVAAIILGARADRRHFSRQTISRLGLGRIQIIHLPCEPFLEYQFYAQNLRPNDFIALAGLGDGSVGYLPLAKSFSQGGYELSPLACFTSPKIEKNLKKAIRQAVIRTGEN